MGLVSYAELTQRHRYFETFSESNVNSDLLYYAEIEINARLAKAFTVPFSDGHPTVKDLIIDMAYYRGLRLKDPDKAEKMREDIVGRIDSICKGDEYIYTGSGTTISPHESSDTIWSTVKDYHPVHAMLEPEISLISSDRLDAEEDERDIL